MKYETFILTAIAMLISIAYIVGLFAVNVKAESQTLDLSCWEHGEFLQTDYCLEMYLNKGE